MAAAVDPLQQERALTSLEEILLYAISNDLRLLESLIDPDHDAELDAMIAAGWGNTPQDQIPNDWRTRPGPERPHTLERRGAISQGMKRRLALAAVSEAVSIPRG